MKTFHFLIATFFGIGKIPKAPGTCASLAAIPCFYFLLDKPLFHGAALIVVYFLGVYTSGKVEKDLGEKDPSNVVIDEVLGMGMAMLFLPREWPFVLTALILFRLFDIWKPYPIHRIEKLPGGWGVMTDDLVAGFYAFCFLFVGNWFIINVVR